MCVRAVYATAWCCLLSSVLVTAAAFAGAVHLDALAARVVQRRDPRHM